MSHLRIKIFDDELELWGDESTWDFAIQEFHSLRAARAAKKLRDEKTARREGLYSEQVKLIEQMGVLKQQIRRNENEIKAGM